LNMSSKNENSSDDLVSIVHSASGACAKVHTYGATVTSFVTERKREVLFVSKLAKLDGSKAIRGGIPLVFPIFGPPSDADSSDMPQHGFARCNRWSLVEDSISDGEEEAVAVFELNYANDDVTNGIGTRGLWAKTTTTTATTTTTGKIPNVTLRLTVRVRPESLITTLNIINTGDINLDDLQALFHTYYAVNGSAALDPDSCAVLSGLDGYSMDDKLIVPSDKPVFHPANTAVTIPGEVDRVYTPPPVIGTGKDKSAQLSIATGKDGSKIDLKIEASLPASGIQLPISIVVWNPHIVKAKGMSDFADEQYHDMICVEPGILSDVPALEPTKEIEFTQTITSI